MKDLSVKGLKFNLIWSETVPTTKRPATRWHAVAARERGYVKNVINVINPPAAGINHVKHVNHVPRSPDEGANGDRSHDTVDWRVDYEHAF